MRRVVLFSRLSVLAVVVLMFSLLPGGVLAEGSVSGSRTLGLLTKKEQTGLVKIMANEKLAHDVCKVMYEQWETCTFYRMLRTKKEDMSKISEFLVSHSVPNPLKGYGVGRFPISSLNDLYSELTDKGSKSLVDAIEVCSYIEKNNVRLINKCLQEVHNPSVKDLLKGLLKESESHIKMFSGCLKDLGVAGSIHYPCL